LFSIRSPALLLLSSPLVLAPFAPQRAAGESAAAASSPWDARQAEHLLNRAAFGGDRAAIAELVALGREAAVERLLASAGGPGTPVCEPWPALRPGLLLPAGIDGTELELDPVQVQWPEFRREMGEYVQAWIAAMVEGRDPLRDRMALFWHNHFVSGFEQVGDAHEMVVQAAFLRAHGLGDFRTLVDGMSRDPAMLDYLDNNLNVRAHPNENWARELLELFTLGEGRYSEDDVKQAARAYTGWTDREQRFLVDRVEHDFGMKTVLGLSGNLDGDRVADVLLEQPACGEWLAWKLLSWFEGVEPSAERLAEYAQVLRASDYDVAACLRRLFLDDAFYRDEIVGNRIAGPIDFLVGATRRLGADVPPQMIFAGADLLGQKLLDPPSVKGWEGGLTWLPTAAVHDRSNLAGAMLGLVDLAWLKLGGGDGMGTDSPGLDYRTLKPRDPLRLLLEIQAAGWTPALDLTTGLTGEPRADAALLLERLLARAPDAALIERLAGLLAHERTELADDSGEPWGTPQARQALARVAHVILSLPEAMLD
jgi:hypothetical protein